MRRGGGCGGVRTRGSSFTPSSPSCPWTSRCRGASFACSCAACLFGCQHIHPDQNQQPGVQRTPSTTRHQGRGVRTLLPRRPLGLGGKPDPDEPVLGLELLHGLGRVVDEAEAGRLAATELGAQAEDGDLVLGGLVEAGELLAELILGDVGAVGVEDVTEGAKSAICTHLLVRSLFYVSSNPAIEAGESVRFAMADHPCPPGSPSLPPPFPPRESFAQESGKTHTTICLRPSRGLRMNLRVRRVTGASESAILEIVVRLVMGWEGDRNGCVGWLLVFRWCFPSGGG